MTGALRAAAGTKLTAYRLPLNELSAPRSVVVARCREGPIVVGHHPVQSPAVNSAFPSRFLWQLSAFALLGAGLSLRAQELSLLGGITSKENFGRSTSTWQIDYRQDFFANFAGSVAYINEGHLPGHHRDGDAVELWATLPLFDNQMSLAAGAGAYYYYDTKTLRDGTSADVHGTAPIYSLSATVYFSHRVSFRAMFNRINPTKDLTVTTAAVGLGFWFGRDRRPTPGQLGDAPKEHTYVTENELTVFGGQSIVNTFLSETAFAYAAEYRRGLSRHLDGTVTFIHEGDPKIIRRSGVVLQAWAVNTFFDEKFSMGVGVGPYFYIDQRHPLPGRPLNPTTMTPMFSLTFAVKVSEHWLARATWDRVVSSNNRDSDIILVGFGYRWSRGR